MAYEVKMDASLWDTAERMVVEYENRMKEKEGGE